MSLSTIIVAANAQLLGRLKQPGLDLRIPPSEFAQHIRRMFV